MKNKTNAHVTQKGARKHVLSWDSNGAKCSYPNCEVNAIRAKRIQSQRLRRSLQPA